METTVVINSGQINVEVPLVVLRQTIIENFNEDQIFDILLAGINERKMSPHTVFERICDDYSDEIDELVVEKTEELQHYKDTTSGLWATDRPDLIIDKMGLMFQIGEKNEHNLINHMDALCTSSLDPESSEKWEDIKAVLYQTRKELKPNNSEKPNS